jgi:hypothetical protein
MDTPSGPVARSSALRRRLAAGEPLTVRAVAAPAAAGLSPLLSINDWAREILMLGVDGEDVVYRVRTRAVAVGLDSPELRVRGALHDVRPGDGLRIVVRPARAGACVEVNDHLACGVGFTAGMGWAILAYGQGVSPLVHGVLNALWLAGLALPVGYWARTRGDWILALAWAIVGLLVVADVTELVPTPPSELAGALAGLLAGLGLRHRLCPEVAASVRAATRASSPLGRAH